MRLFVAFLLLCAPAISMHPRQARGLHPMCPAMADEAADNAAQHQAPFRDVPPNWSEMQTKKLTWERMRLRCAKTKVACAFDPATGEVSLASPK